MPLKRTHDDAVQDGLALSPDGPSIGSPIDSSTHTPWTSNSGSAQGKQRRLTFTDENGECTTASTSSRPRALPSTSRARFVPGLQTFVGGLQMSQDSSIPLANDSPARSPSSSEPRRSFDAQDAMQPLMMSRSTDAEQRATRSAARRRSQEAFEATVRRSSLQAEQEQLVPGVSPGWHVEAHGRQAMELQDGIRFQDEDGWTPLEAFPAATRQGKLAVKRAKLRILELQEQRQRQRQRLRQRQIEFDTVSQPSTSKLTATIPVESASKTRFLAVKLSASALDSPFPIVDDEVVGDLLDTLSGPLATSSPPASAIQPQSAPCLASSSTSPTSSSFGTVSSTPLSMSTDDDLTTSKLKYNANPRAPHKYTPSCSLSDFEVVETLGTGTFGRVLLVRLKGRDVHDRSAYFALKILAKSDVVRLKQVSHVNSERSILTKVDHPFLINMVASFQDSKNCYMLMEYVIGGEIFSYLRRVGQFSADVARFYISTIVLAIEYLHKNKVVYRDLKPENLLIDANGYTKITDFGFAKEVEDRTWTLCGTPEYLAPEIIQCSGHGSAVDWWSLGILLYEMLAGYPPFYDPNPILIYEKILAGKLVFPEQIDPVSRDLISSLLTTDRSRRLGNLRGGASDVKNHPWFYGVDWRALEERRIPPPIVPYLGQPGDTSNFIKYGTARPSALPGLYGVDQGDHGPIANLFPDF